MSSAMSYSYGICEVPECHKDGIHLHHITYHEGGYYPAKVAALCPTHHRHITAINTVMSWNLEGLTHAQRITIWEKFKAGGFVVKRNFRKPGYVIYENVLEDRDLPVWLWLYRGAVLRRF